MNLNQTFNLYQPELIDLDSARFDLLVDTTRSNNLLVCGEIHGVVENADILYSLFHHLGFSTFALERTKEEAGRFIDSLKPNAKVDFSLIDKSVFIASVMSPQFAKAIHTLFSESKLKDVVYVDSDLENREQGIAKNILNLDKTQKTLCVLGNWHTTIGVKGHKSALEYIRNNIPNVPCLDYKYCSGQFYNIANGLVSFDNISLEHSHYTIEQKTKNNFVLYVPEATPITKTGI